ncbi:MAG: aminotransferase class V-fold PLP-dependent enzyme [Terriglobia bacterium]
MDIIDSMYDPEIFRQAGHRLIDQLTEYLLAARQGQMPVLPEPAPPALADRHQQAPPAEAAPDAMKYLAQRVQELVEQGIHLQHPGYIGHQVCPPLPVSSLADLAAGVFNQSMPVYEMSPSATHIERQTARWLCNIIGWDKAADGVFTSGGSLGNLTALLAARNHATGGAAWEKGVRSGPPLAILVSEHAHYSVARSAGILGLGQENVLRVPVDRQFRMDAAALAACYHEAMAQGKKVVAVVASAGTTATGSFDPLREIGKFCRTQGVWFHVDGAHGASVLLSPKYRSLADGIELADSVIWDAHKMLFVSSLATALLFRQGSHGYEAFSQEASYLFGRHAFPEYDLGLRTIECTRPMQAWKLWICFQLYGECGLGELVTQKLDLARAFAALLKAQPDFELLTEPMCNILCFRHIPGGAKREELSVKLLDEHQAKIRQRVLASGRFFLVQTRIGDALYLRCTLMNPYTTEHDLARLLALIRKCAAN